jgi:hypothetical protein
MKQATDWTKVIAKLENEMKDIRKNTNMDAASKRSCQTALKVIKAGERQKKEIREIEKGKLALIVQGGAATVQYFRTVGMRLPLGYKAALRKHDTNAT